MDKYSRAKVTLVARAIPSTIRCLVLIRTMPADQPFGYETVRILRPNKFVDRVAIELRSCRARALLQMMCHASRGTEPNSAKRACDASPKVYARSQVLFIIVVSYN